MSPSCTSSPDLASSGTPAAPSLQSLDLSYSLLLTGFGQGAPFPKFRSLSCGTVTHPLEIRRGHSFLDAAILAGRRHIAALASCDKSGRVIHRLNLVLPRTAPRVSLVRAIL